MKNPIGPRNQVMYTQIFQIFCKEAGDKLDNNYAALFHDNIRRSMDLWKVCKLKIKKNEQQSIYTNYFINFNGILLLVKLVWNCMYTVQAALMRPESTVSTFT